MSEPLPFALHADVPLAPLTTLELGGPARYLARAAGARQVAAACAWARARDLDVHVLGGGSNVVVADAGVDGLVLQCTDARLRIAACGAHVRVRAGAALAWDALVAAAVEAGLAGMACLSGIPGWVGAVPVQNVGAYGQQVADTLESVDLVARDDGRLHRLPAAALGLGYRTSRLKDAWAERFVVVAASFLLGRGAEAEPRHPELAAALAAAPRPLRPAQVRAAVLAVRRRKGMVWAADGAFRRSVGSFFINPVVDAARAAALRDAHGPALPAYPLGDGRVRLAAAWLVEQAGFGCGFAAGPVGISGAHSLALVHHGGGTAAQLLALAATIQAAVAARYGVTLEREPALLGPAAGAARRGGA